MNQLIQNLINAHRQEKGRLESEYTQPQVKVSKLASFIARSYETARNAVEESEGHLLRKRAVKRTIKRVKAFEVKNTMKVGEKVMKEMVWAQYLKNLPAPSSKIVAISNILQKYIITIQDYKRLFKKDPDSTIINMLYAICGIEIERLLVPYDSKDAQVNLQYSFMQDKHILKSPELPSAQEPVQNYIAVHRGNTKSDDDIIMYNLFLFKFPFWRNATRDQLVQAAQHLEPTLTEIQKHLKYKPLRKQMKEVIRQSIPFKILNKVIYKNLGDAESIISDPDKLNVAVEDICQEEYGQNKKTLQKAIIGSIVYIFITKILLALVVEVPYELSTEGHVNFFTLGINIIFPTIIMFIIANSFSIPNQENTDQLKKMISAIVSENRKDDRSAFLIPSNLSTSSVVIFKLLFFLLPIPIYGLIIYILTRLHYNIVGMAIFIIFFSTIFFVSHQLRNKATELKVINTSPSVFSPLIDMFSLPILYVGQKLSEGVKDLNMFAILFDRVLEPPFKKSIRSFEQWNDYVRETKEEIV